MIKIQAATVANARLIADIGAKAFVESHSSSAAAADIESYVSTKLAVDVVEAELNDPENLFHLLYFQGQAVGYSKIMLHKSYPLIAATNVTKLERLYLLKEFYGFKLGLALFEFIIALSKNANQAGIWLFVWTGNERAMRFYRQAGFEIIGDGYFKISETHANPNYIYLSTLISYSQSKKLLKINSLLSKIDITT